MSWCPRVAAAEVQLGMIRARVMGTAAAVTQRTIKEQTALIRGGEQSDRRRTRQGFVEAVGGGVVEVSAPTLL